MTPTSVVNVVRYSALVAGIGYGIVHRQTLQAKYDEHVQKMAIKRQEDLVKQAKEEYAKIRAAKSAPPTPNAIVTNPEDPNFDLEKLLKYWEEKL
ncbi:hypothetical protein MGL_0350 [Malassezia globosa CBS 7966]|uniref:ATP synthase F(0) complex subunit e, mitochondrial n=1 Tax=Malassezia globosa (strain ATCC MYA-4612 / CBS 7966) TaxID=425265 RepID=A8PT11_MALGO|nr:uncharacterized protein MGL_0350 [Malassezia globosa CBS 7966]EDP45361.1 hypothetical protein MGL_0350 [Malassezia globosa CBS 7966]